MEEKIKELKELVQLFQNNIDEYKSKNYDEANTRVDFIDKFFELLDWDVRNKKGYAENYRDVVREDKVRIEGKPKAPDYSFRIGGIRKFFAEAKKPSVNIKDEFAPAFQIRRYGYTAKLSLCILTDFEEFAVYDTRIKPNKKDKSSTARVFYCKFDEYEEKFDEIYNNFSKNAILKGSFDKYVKENKSKRGTSEIDKEFLKLIEKWRSELAKNIALRNKELSIYELNHYVQLIIDRIIFLRIAEDRDMEEYQTLYSVTNKENVYKNLNKIFEKADSKYNAGLFEVKEALFKLKVDDKILCSIIEGLYYPDCPYEFSVLGVEILGNIYEQFLGKTIRLTEAHHAKIEEKPEVRKAGGVYYTPQYIVNYIVKNTIGEKVKGKDPDKVAELKICDPACGSGSFLLGAYEFLLNWHLDWYLKDKNKAKALKDGIIYQSTEIDFHLSIKEKQRILVNNIFGVDIDQQAVEVTKLSLLLKLLEGENQESTGQLFKISETQLLPNLSKNIKCGNSLISSDYYEQQDLGLITEDEMRRINVFDWQEEFKDIFVKGGFDCIIGNPPYFNLEIAESNVKNYISKHYDSYEGKGDILYFFLERGINILNKSGELGFITSRYFFQATYAKKLRKFITDNINIKEILDFKDFAVFSGVGIHTAITILTRNKIKDTKIKIIKDGNFGSFNFKEFFIQIDNSDWLLADPIELKLLNKIKNDKIQLGDIAIIEQGQKSGLNSVFGVEREIAVKLENKPLRKLIKNSHILRYFIDFKDKYLIYADKDFELEEYPKIKKYLETFKTELKNRAEAKDNLYPWFRLQRPRDKKLFDAKEKIVVPYRAEFNKFAYDDQQYFNDGGDIRIIVLKENCQFKLKYILGILNSSLMNFYYQFVGRRKGKIFEYFVEPLKKIPVPKINFIKQDDLIKHVDVMLDTQIKFHRSRSESDKNIYLKKIQALDKVIDQFVFDLYELTTDEIKLILENK